MIDYVKVLIIAGAAACAIVFHVVLYISLFLLARRTPTKLDDDLVKWTKFPTLPMLVCIAVLIAQPALDFGYPGSRLVTSAVESTIASNPLNKFLTVRYVGDNLAANVSLKILFFTFSQFSYDCKVI